MKSKKYIEMTLGDAYLLCVKEGMAVVCDADSASVSVQEDNDG